MRPTAVRARRALFDSLGDLSGKRICDLFSGSGAIGFESASRGAASVLFVEKSPQSLAAIIVTGKIFSVLKINDEAKPLQDNHSHRRLLFLREKYNGKRSC